MISSLRSISTVCSCSGTLYGTVLSSLTLCKKYWETCPIHLLKSVQAVAQCTWHMGTFRCKPKRWILSLICYNYCIDGSYALDVLLKHNALYARNDLKLGTFKDPFAIFYQILLTNHHPTAITFWSAIQLLFHYVSVTRDSMFKRNMRTNVQGRIKTLKLREGCFNCICISFSMNICQM